MAYTLSFTLNLGSSQTGLTLKAQLFDTAGANVGAAITTGFLERGAGIYIWTGSIPDGHRGGVDFLTHPAGVFKTSVAINPQEAEYTDVKTSSRVPAGAAVIVSSPVAVGGDITIVHGDDYSDADGRALPFTVTGAPDLLTASAIAFSVALRATGVSVLTVSAHPAASATLIKVQLTAAQTAALALGGNVHVYDIQATIAGRKLTLVRGALTVLADYAP